MPYRVKNIVRKGEIACYKQFLLFSQCFLQLYIFSALLCGNELKGVDKYVSHTAFANSIDSHQQTDILQNYYLQSVSFVLKQHIAKHEKDSSKSCKGFELIASHLKTLL